MKIVSLLVLLALAVNASGCGQKGPLVLPDAQHPRKKARFPGAPKMPSTRQAPATAPAAPSAPAGPAPNPAPPVAAPEGAPPSNPSLDPAPQG